MADPALDVLTPDRPGRNIVCTSAADTDTPVGKVPLLPFAATRLASLVQRSSVALAPACSSAIVLPFVHPFGSDILEDFSIRFRRGLSYPVTTREAEIIDNSASVALDLFALSNSILKRFCP